MKGFDAERGSMTVEVAFLLVLLVVPLFYLVGTLARVQAGAYAVSAAAREAGRTFVTAADVESGIERAHAAAALVLQAHGFSEEEGVVTLVCPDEQCLVPGSQVLVQAEIDVELPLIPDFMRDAVPSSIELTSEHVEPVDEFRESG